MYIGNHFAGNTFYDCTGNRTDELVIGEDGHCNFTVNGGSVSVWVKR